MPPASKVSILILFTVCLFPLSLLSAMRLFDFTDIEEELSMPKTHRHGRCKSKTIKL